ncbi:hypothetical protein INS49_013295 [Diaporthe citri]|uniref:uncharacterized protein n=1 Tax=Diaporthe citri TaxID=83186 RepID=UPI001C8027E8|nr:uncharacterized protein INS49_013295 [Diaporthe citri]KAG6357418.1 hypothetical protein INS49_013295 [Diaporthe citri]
MATVIFHRDRIPDFFLFFSISPTFAVVTKKHLTSWPEIWAAGRLRRAAGHNTDIIIRTRLPTSRATQSLMMSNPSSQCVHPSDKVVSENMIASLGRLPLEVLLVLAHYASDTGPEIDLFRESDPRIVLPHDLLNISLVYRWALHLVPVVKVGPVCHAGYAGQIRAGNGPERSASGGCNRSADGFALDPLDKGCSRLSPRRSGRKRGSDPPPQPSRASSKKGAARTFACHFYLHDRIGHSACLNVRLARLSDVRQHLLERTHNQVVHCAVCGTTFTGRTSTEARGRRDEHVQAATCEPSSSPFNYPGITEDEDRSIREIARNTRTADYTGVRRWFMIWDCLFPGEPRPESPFLTDVPDIQRVFDWAGAIFSDSDRWLALPNEPWTSAMNREERNARMSNFIQSFIAEARDLVEEDSGPVEDDHASGADNSSYVNVVNVDIPDPSGATENLAVASLAASFDSNRPADALSRSYLDLGSATGSSQAPNPHTLGPMVPSTSGQPAGTAPIPFRSLNHPTVDVAQDMQQHAASGSASSLDDPALPAFQDSSADDPAINPDYEWFNSLNGWDNFGNDEAGPGDNYAPPDEDELGGRH